MNRRHRLVHLLIWVALGALVAATLTAARAVRPAAITPASSRAGGSTR